MFKLNLPSADQALPGRDTVMPISNRNFINGQPLQPPFAEGLCSVVVGMGCFWGAEEIFWRLPGVFTTAAGYQGGYTPHPTYEEVCTGRTGHTEAVMVAYHPEQISTETVLRHFWEQHDPTQGYRQGNDTGTQYRSTLYYTTAAQLDLIERSVSAYAPALANRGYPEITTEIAPADDHHFYFAEGYHQQYLYKVPNGYRCHSSTGLELPAF